MSSVSETLQQLVRRRLEELGAARGRNGPISLREAYLAVPDPGVSYEVVRRVEKGGHTNIGDKAARTIATMLGVEENDVWRAAGRKPKLGPFELPSRADKLEPSERAVVLSVIDAILAAGERDGEAESSVTHFRGSGITFASRINRVPEAAMEDPPKGRRRSRLGESEEPWTER